MAMFSADSVSGKSSELSINYNYGLEALTHVILSELLFNIFKLWFDEQIQDQDLMN